MSFQRNVVKKRHFLLSFLFLYIFFISIFPDTIDGSKNTNSILKKKKKHVYMSSFAYLRVTLHQDPSFKGKEYCVNYNQFPYKEIPSTPEEAPKSSFQELGRYTFFNDITYKNITLGTSFNEIKINQILNALPHKGIDNLLFYFKKRTSDKEKDTRYITSNFYLPQHTRHPTPIFYVYKNDFDDLKKLGNNSDLRFQFYRPKDSKFEFAEIFIFLIAVISIILGSKLGVYNASKRSQKKVTLPTTTQDYDLSVTSKCTDNNNKSTSTINVNGENETPSRAVTSFCILIQISFLAGILILTYFFRNEMMVIFYIAVIIVGTFSIGILFQTLSLIIFKKDLFKISLNDIFKNFFDKTINIGIFNERFGFYSIIGYSLGFAITVIWFFNKDNPYSFLLLNFINLCISINLISLLETYRFIWIIVVMIGLLLYDFFMVFVTPYITPDGCSMMIKAATGKDCQSPEQKAKMAYDEWEPLPSPEQNFIHTSIAPMVFMFPRLADSMLSCLDLSIELEYRPTILGMGDVVIPGIAVAFAHHADKFLFKQKTYYGTFSIIGYSIGLVTTMFALEYMQMAQPALIYLVPFTLLAIIIPALIRKEFKKFVFSDLSYNED
ncbi:Presenilin/signal peptide peptidase family and Peptidase A22B, signal peptide peptidase family-containing protein [Strongyloides ratti]|uniref:Presenilin/signal peptide peptidase family and Peptidase A22B, signal peptide peptidase family-containing protein n=1 Tax=Strongyloides ratti TaxID=34506 RepID=A0A090L8Z6_STRRB|nr:Presenilin/signal peptide peptidase family and Peptidase A22B, signal peptide peptidase family-containing protein [Strongyloides ratti]CEF64623.1 Presenilin/signal peptide peptidase family and Peptidase A22B, signal peptide peptidase family-containing protein [Strongyloides ratti]